jgi:uncharacterized alkaline shock family protein YloU
MYDPLKNMDARGMELPNTVFIRDIETRVLQGIVLQSLAKIEDISLLEGNLFDSLLGRDVERVKGIHVEQEQKGRSVDIRVEINIVYGVSIPAKSEEIQTKLVEEVTRWTGLHVTSVHVVFKELISPQAKEREPSPEAEDFEPAY